MGAYRCDDCDVSWPPVKDFVPCPGCEKPIGYRADCEPISHEWAQTLAQHWRETAVQRRRDAEVERKLDDALVAAFARDMDAELGPSTSEPQPAHRPYPPFAKGL